MRRRALGAGAGAGRGLGSRRRRTRAPCALWRSWLRFGFALNDGRLQFRLSAALPWPPAPGAGMELLVELAGGRFSSAVVRSLDRGGSRSGSVRPMASAAPGPDELCA